MQFDFIDFNRVRLVRGKPAARVSCQNEEGKAWLWMTEKDLRENIEEYGPHLGLVTAAQQYGIHPSVSIGWYKNTDRPFLARRDPERDRDGYWTHPDILWDNDRIGNEADDWLRYLGFEGDITWLEHDKSAREIWKRYSSGDADVLAWEPKPPAGEGWYLISIHDAEEGPGALWIRPKAGQNA